MLGETETRCEDRMFPVHLGAQLPKGAWREHGVELCCMNQRLGGRVMFRDGRSMTGWFDVMGLWEWS